MNALDMKALLALRPCKSCETKGYDFYRACLCVECNALMKVTLCMCIISTAIRTCSLFRFSRLTHCSMLQWNCICPVIIVEDVFLDKMFPFLSWIPPHIQLLLVLDMLLYSCLACSLLIEYCHVISSSCEPFVLFF